jgi:hypothetical protein
MKNKKQSKQQPKTFAQRMGWTTDTQNIKLKTPISTTPIDKQDNNQFYRLPNKDNCRNIIS